MPLPLQGPNSSQLQEIVSAANESTSALRALLAETRHLAVQAQEISDRLIEAEEEGSDVSTPISNIEYTIQHLDEAIGSLSMNVRTTRDVVFNTQYVVRQAREDLSSVEIPEPEVAHG